MFGGCLPPFDRGLVSVCSGAAALFALADPLDAFALAGLGAALSLIGEALAEVGGALAGIGLSFPLVGDPLALVRRDLPVADALLA